MSSRHRATVTGGTGRVPAGAQRSRSDRWEGPNDGRTLTITNLRPPHRFQGEVRRSNVSSRREEAQI
ncbi:hypothetical protein AAFF_G00261260 [Aldrovandia affinis]|uniref:Uncharacterized protein n=1 Tax=Aldrovandia affinis TaxID=143900 RepID=A0AAD7RBR1_9TELE|nr:hypothetical protein AAFF_G00261260 [Aldrovandia affinis]